MSKQYGELVDRFWARVRKSDGCWEWTSFINYRGYGTIYADGRVQTASRVSYKIAYGEFDQKLHVLHKCDNRKCVRPDHLFLGTHADNMRDMARKGRSTRKIKECDVKTIRHLYFAELRMQKEIAAYFNLSQPRISVIINGRE